MKVEMKSGPIYFVLSISSNIVIAFGAGLIIYQYVFPLDIVNGSDYLQGGISGVLLGLVGWLTVIYCGRSLIIENGKLIVKNYFEKVIFECLLSEIDRVELTGLHKLALFLKDRKFKLPSDLKFTTKIHLIEELRLKKLSRNHPDIFVLNAYLKDAIGQN